MATVDVTAQLVRELLSYDPDTGKLIWRPRTLEHISPDWQRRAWNTRNANQIAHYLNKGNGYLYVQIQKKSVLAHRVIWLHFTGAWPEFQIDHINGDRLDNRIANLRDVPLAANMQNKRHKKIGVEQLPIGVYRHSQNTRLPYIAQISVGNKGRHIGSFSSPAEAREAYLAAKLELHPGYCSD